MAIKEKKAVETPALCYHCGELCSEEQLGFDDKFFCCNGCKLVYEILEQNDLCNYYDLQNSPGISLKNRDYAEKFNFLENEEIIAQLTDFSSSKLNKITFKIPSIHCSSCIWLLEHLHNLRPGIVLSRVNFVRKEVAIDFNPEELSLKTIVELLATLGYEPEINLGNATESKTKKINRTLYLQIGVAGFCFGNVMLLSFPEYFGFEGLDDNVQRFINYINIAFSLPVVFFSAKGYFISAYQGLKQRYVNIDVPIALGIITLFSRSLYEILSQSGPGYLDSLSGLVFFLLIGKWIQSRTYDGLSFERDYKSYFPLAVSRISGDEKEIIQITQLKQGDRIEVRNQEIIPADAVLISDHAAIDYSFVTGEAETIEKQAGDRIYAGGRQVGFAVVLDIVKPVSQSYLTQLWNKDTFNSESPYDSIIDRISKYFTFTVLLIALFTGIYWAYVEPSAVMNAVTAVLIVACPCALALATPFTLGNAMAILGKHKFYLKHMNVLQNLWNISEVIFDKTGTLTKRASTAISFKGSLTDQEKGYILSLVNHSTHPLSRSIAQSLNGVKPFAVTNFKEFKGAGLSGVTNSVIVKVGSAAFTEYPDPTLNVNTQVFVTIDGQPSGYFSHGNTYRQEIGLMVHGLKYQLAVLSGDNASEKENLSKIFPPSTHLVFNQTPEEKLNFIQQEQEAQRAVLMLGDGLNDAGALKQADVGIAVTEDVSAFTPACDAILYGGNLAELDKYLAFSLNTKKVIFASFTISFLYNVIGLSLAVSANLTPLFAAILMPLSSVTVVAFATFTVRWLAFRKGL